MLPAPTTLSDQSSSQGTVLVTHDAPASAAAGSPGGALLTQLPLLVAIVAIFYFLVIRPQNQERKTHQKLVESLKKDDDIITQSGIFGRVVRVGGARVELEIAPKVRIWVEASSVKVRQTDDAAGTDDASDDSKKGN
ncbi:MAG: preprotein translocase subunit YajC [Oligoflexia bacterium]|nr:preprotein translocase subunit YajC [Oligoflexia bacterium]